MATITSSGIGSGLDVNGIITKLMDIERQPLTQLATREASFQAKLTAFGTLKGAFASLQSAARGLDSYALFSGMAATSSDSDVLSASANTAATPGSYSVTVNKLAQGQTIVSDSFESITGDITSITGDGRLRISLGEVLPDNPATSGAADPYFEADDSKVPVTIDISDGSSLANIRDAINNANAGVTARIVDVGNENYKLMISANGVGAKTSIQIEALGKVIDDPTGTGLTQFNFNPATDTVGGFDQTEPAQDAEIKVNSLTITRSTNTISDAITGVTLRLAEEGSTTLTIAKNTSAVKSALETFVTAYNTANEQVRQLSAYNTATQEAAILQGDSGVRALQTALRDMVGFSVLTGSSSIRSLSSLGISQQRDGSLQFNATKLETALRDTPDAVEQLLRTGNEDGVSGIAPRMTTMLNNILNESNGILASRTDGIDRNIAEIERRRATLTRRLTQIEIRYREQFSALDVMVSNMNSTSQFLQQQLSALSKSSG